MNKIVIQKNSELAHYGVKGMKWGVRKERATADRKVRQSRRTLAKERRIISDEKLKSTVNRLEMEKKLKNLVAEDIVPGQKIINDQLLKFGTTALSAAAGVVGAALVKEALAKKGIGG